MNIPSPIKRFKSIVNDLRNLSPYKTAILTLTLFGVIFGGIQAWGYLKKEYSKSQEPNPAPAQQGGALYSAVAQNDRQYTDTPYVVSYALGFKTPEGARVNAINACQEEGFNKCEKTYVFTGHRCLYVVAIQSTLQSRSPQEPQELELRYGGNWNREASDYEPFESRAAAENFAQMSCDSLTRSDPVSCRLIHIKCTGNQKIVQTFVSKP